MISSLIDTALIAAFAFTSWSTGRTWRELRLLRGATSELQMALQASDTALNRAAHAVVMLKSDGAETLKALEDRMREARDITCQLEGAAVAADLHQALTLEFQTEFVMSAEDLANRAANDRATAVADEQDHWRARLASRFASASGAIR